MYDLPDPVNYLHPINFKKFKILKITQINHDTALFRFEANLPLGDVALNPESYEKPLISLPSHVIIKDDTMQIARAYSPISYNRFHFDVLVKQKPGGFLSRYIFSKKEGDMLEIRGPICSMPEEYTRNVVSNIAMIAGGTGITPCYQLIKRVLGDEKDTTKLWLLYANKQEEDILMKNELNLLQEVYPDRLCVSYTLETPSPGWNGFNGYISEDMIKKSMPLPGIGREEVAVIVCGPDGMVAHVAGPKTENDRQGKVGGILKKFGFVERN
ncbi:hypothetical protein HK096_007158, partial [Nowakowskiella sp. JEL0078]